MRRLHRGDDFGLSETFEIVGMHYLSVFAAVAVVLHFRLLRDDRFDEFQRLAIARVANGMYGHLKPAFHHLSHEPSVETILIATHAAIPRPVGIIVNEPRPPRTERAVIKSLD